MAGVATGLPRRGLAPRLRRLAHPPVVGADGGALPVRRSAAAGGPCGVGRARDAVAVGGAASAAGREQLIPHERYRLTGGGGPASQGNDIALVRLASPLPASRFETVQLQSRQLEANFGFPGACAVVTGWGRAEAWEPGRDREEARALPDRLRAVDLPVIDNATMRRAVSRSDHGRAGVRRVRAGHDGLVPGRQRRPAGGAGRSDRVDAARHRELRPRLRPAGRLRRLHPRLSLHRLDPAADVAVTAFA